MYNYTTQKVNIDMQAASDYQARQEFKITDLVELASTQDRSIDPQSYYSGKKLYEMQVYLFKDSLYSDDTIEIRRVNDDVACLYYDPNYGKQYLWGAKRVEGARLRKVYPFQTRYLHLQKNQPFDKRFPARYWKEYAIAIVYEGTNEFQVKRVNFEFSAMQAVDFNAQNIKIVSRKFEGKFIDLAFTFNSIAVHYSLNTDKTYIAIQSFEKDNWTEFQIDTLEKLLLYAIDHGNRTRFFGLDSTDNSVHVLDFYKSKNSDNLQMYSKATNVRVEERVFEEGHGRQVEFILGGQYLSWIADS